MPPLPATFVPAGAANPPPEEVLGGVPNPPALLPAMIYKLTELSCGAELEKFATSKNCGGRHVHLAIRKKVESTQSTAHRIFGFNKTLQKL